MRMALVFQLIIDGVWFGLRMVALIEQTLLLKRHDMDLVISRIDWNHGQELIVLSFVSDDYINISV